MKTRRATGLVRIVQTLLAVGLAVVELAHATVVSKVSSNGFPLIQIKTSESASVSVDDLFEVQNEGVNEDPVSYTVSGASMSVSSVVSPAFTSTQDTSDVTGVFATFGLSPRYSLMLYGTKTLSLLLTEVSLTDNKVVRIDRFHEENLNSTNIVCLDAFIDEDDQKFFVICHETDDGVVPRQIKVIVGDLKVYQILILTSLAQSKVPVPEGCGFQLRQFTNMVNNSKVQALVYWQRCYPVDGKPASQSSMFLACNITRQFGYTLDCNADFQFQLASAEGIGINSLWDIQEMSPGQYIFAGYPSLDPSANMILRRCDINLTNLSLIEVACFEAAHSTMVGTSGFLSLSSDLTYIEASLSPRRASVCTIDPMKMNTTNWTSGCQYASGWPAAQAPGPIYVGAAAFSTNSVFLTLVQQNLSYIGYSASSVGNQVPSWGYSDITRQATPQSGRVLSRRPSQPDVLGISFLARPQIILDSNSPNFQSGSIEVTANPPKGAAISAQFSVGFSNKQQSLMFLGDTYSRRQQDYKFFANSLTPLFPTDVQGSVITYNMTFVNNKLTGALGFDSESLRRADFSFPRSPKFPQGLPKLSGIYVGDGFLFGFDINSTMYLFSCTNPLSQNYICTFKVTFKSRSVNLSAMRVLRAEVVSNYFIYASLEGDTKGSNPRPERILLVVNLPFGLSGNWTLSSRYLGYSSFADSAGYLATSTDGDLTTRGYLALAFNNEDRQAIDVYSVDLNGTSITLETTIQTNSVGTLSAVGPVPTSIMAFSTLGQAITIRDTAVVSRETSFGTGVCTTSQNSIVTMQPGNKYQIINTRGQMLTLPLDSLSVEGYLNIVCQSNSRYMAVYTNTPGEKGPKGFIWVVALDSFWNSNSRVLSKQALDFPTNQSMLVGVFQLKDRLIVVYQDEFGENFFSEVSTPFPGLETGMNKAPSGNATFPDNGEDLVINDTLSTAATDLYNNSIMQVSPISVRWQNPAIKVSVIQQQQVTSTSEIDLDSVLWFGGHTLAVELMKKVETSVKLSQRLQPDLAPIVTSDRVKFMWPTSNSILGISQSQGKIRLHKLPISANTTLPGKSFEVSQKPGTGELVSGHAASLGTRDVWVFMTLLSPNSPDCAVSIVSMPSTSQKEDQPTLQSVTLFSTMRCTQPKLLLQSPNTLLISEEWGVSVWNLTITDQAAVSKVRVGALPIMTDFDVVALSSSVSAVFGITPGSNSLTAVLLNNNIPLEPVKVQLSDNAIALKTMSCSQVDASQDGIPITCVGDTYSENIIEFTVQVRGYQTPTTVSFSVSSTYYHLKFALYEPTEVRVTSKYVLATMVSSKSGLKDRVLAGWKRQMKGIAAKMIFMEVLPTGQTPYLSSVRDYASLAVAKDQNGAWRAFVALPDEVEPKIKGYTLNRLILTLPSTINEANYLETLSKVALKVTGTISSSSASITLDTLFTKPEPPNKKDSKSSWVYKILIVIGLALVVAAVYVWFTKFRKPRSEDDYYAVNPGSIGGVRVGKGAGENSTFNNDTIGSHKQDEIPA